MRFSSLIEVLALHRRIIEQSGGALGVRDFGLLESAIAQPRMTFGGKSLYPSLLEKAAALGFSIIMKHPFVDGNKRTGHAVAETLWSYPKLANLTCSHKPLPNTPSIDWISLSLMNERGCLKTSVI